MKNSPRNIAMRKLNSFEKDLQIDNVGVLDESLKRFLENKMILEIFTTKIGDYKPSEAQIKYTQRLLEKSNTIMQTLNEKSIISDRNSILTALDNVYRYLANIDDLDEIAQNRKIKAISNRYANPKNENLRELFISKIDERLNAKNLSDSAKIFLEKIKNIIL